MTPGEIPIDRAHEFIPTQPPELEPLTDENSEEPSEPDYYGAGITAEEGLWMRSGWAGSA
ncbi:hypothetical protein [Glaciibacter psychrotolerans]|uniref:Uncharacterized protein n=1 Tax=Glaciibacter psychrotolerans TaxID=670054 RepID=A0A7Z0J5C5_9MICO|nr:hypothetical protein [Leifsonia psychrotolerans]NYJ19312.1 hypothetical protein [Leifsonia psychrotolerans]